MKGKLTKRKGTSTGKKARLVRKKPVKARVKKKTPIKAKFKRYV